MRKIPLLATILIIAVCLSSSAWAKDLTNRIGVGYNNQVNFSYIGGENSDITAAFVTAQSISAKYWFNEDLGIEPLFGYFTAKNGEIGGWAAEIAAKCIYNINKEENMNFYGGGGVGLIPMKIDYGRDSDTATGFTAMAFLGIEFFLSGLPNLAFDAEFGFQYVDVDKFAQLSTYGGGFGVMGIRYYF
jgi:hypothetical protein